MLSVLLDRCSVVFASLSLAQCVNKTGTLINAHPGMNVVQVGNKCHRLIRLFYGSHDSSTLIKKKTFSNIFAYYSCYGYLSTWHPSPHKMPRLQMRETSKHNMERPSIQLFCNSGILTTTPVHTLSGNRSKRCVCVCMCVCVSFLFVSQSRVCVYVGGGGGSEVSVAALS